MMVILKSITREGSRFYGVVIEEAGGANRKFTLEVEEGDITLVKWQDDLAAYMGQNLAPASPLFDAVLAFHRAKSIRTPDS